MGTCETANLDVHHSVGAVGAVVCDWASGIPAVAAFSRSVLRPDAHVLQTSLFVCIGIDVVGISLAQCTG